MSVQGDDRPIGQRSRKPTEKGREHSLNLKSKGED